MKYTTNVNVYLLSFLWIIVLLFSGSCPVLGARLAGEEGVISVTPTPSQPKKKLAPVKPAAEKKQPQAQVKVPAEKRITQKKKVPVKQEPDTRYVTIDFDDVDIGLFIKFISELTGKNFVVDKGVKGKVTIISPTKISVNEAYKVFKSVLDVHGFTTVPAGSIIKIVPALDARSKSIETRLREETIAPEDKVVTQLIPLAFANPEELKKLFAPLISKSSLIVSYPPTRMLIVTDVLSNIKRLLKIVEAIDVVGIGEEISVIPLEHATASLLSKSLESIFQQAALRAKKGEPLSPVLRIVADERTNSLIILATEDDALRIKKLIRLLDKEIPRGEGDIHVYYLQNANAEDLVKVLLALPSEEKKKAEKGKAPVISEDVQIVADKATNSLVIKAKKHDYLVIEDIIEKLDIPRAMVYIEALIMEVNVDKEFRLGVEWLGMEDFTYRGRKGGVFAGSGGAGGAGDYSGIKGLSGGSLPSGFSLGVVGEAITIGNVVFPNVAAILQAYQKDSDVNILSTPQILTTDNEEAEIKVGENVPYLTTTGTTTTTGISYESYEYKDVGVTLKITPQINQERFVRLKIFQENVTLKKGAEEYRPTTLKRSSETTVIVKDKNTVVIGGMIGESTERGAYQVPCLGDIPGLGLLFKSRSRSRNKTNLFVFLTPHIIENPIEARKIYDEKKEEIEKIKGGAIKMYNKPELKGQGLTVK
ncbi:MAG TPA: type II secretion system secretin GspD [Desulfatiglandales bacterium]|nr:type II secretion system secretin GspD [Desulfatiglandales bacterium]